MKHKLLTALMIASIAVFVVDAQAAGRGRHYEGGKSMERGMPLLHSPWDRVEDIGREIGLTDDQLSQIQSIRKTHREKVSPLRAEQDLRRDDLHEAMISRTPASEKDIIKLVDRLNEIHGIVFKETVMASHQIRSLLTQEQADKLRDLRDERKEARRNEHREQRQERRQERREERFEDRQPGPDKDKD